MAPSVYREAIPPGTESRQGKSLLALISVNAARDTYPNIGQQWITGTRTLGIDRTTLKTNLTNVIGCWGIFET
jgi:hypothetical protein